VLLNHMIISLLSHLGKYNIPLKPNACLPTRRNSTQINSTDLCSLARVLLSSHDSVGIKYRSTNTKSPTAINIGSIWSKYIDTLFIRTPTSHTKIDKLESRLSRGLLNLA